MKFAILGLSGVLLLSGCASSPSLTLEDQAKLIEYEKCLLLQQDNLNTINEKLGQRSSEFSLIETLARQSEASKATDRVPRLEIHLKNCTYYRP